jgi:cytochrome c oxidase subunit 4
LSVAVADVDLGRWNFIAAAGIATCKGVFILLFFMHVRYSTPLIWLFSTAGFFWLAILFALGLSDYVTR